MKKTFILAFTLLITSISLYTQNEKIDWNDTKTTITIDEFEDRTSENLNLIFTNLDNVIEIKVDGVPIKITLSDVVKIDNGNLTIDVKKILDEDFGDLMGIESKGFSIQIIEKPNVSKTVIYSFKVPKRENNTQGPTQILFPVFEKIVPHKEFEKNLKNRILILGKNNNDFGNGNTLYKLNKKYESSGSKCTIENRSDKSNCKYIIAKGLSPRHSLSVYITYDKLKSVEKATVTINGKDFSYPNDLGSVKTTFDEGIISDTDEAANKESTIKKGNEHVKTKLEIYLEIVIEKLNDNKFLNITDFQEIQLYKKELEDATSSKNLNYNNEENNLLSQIKSWAPDYLLLSRHSLTNLDFDEADINVTYNIKDKTASETHHVGTFYSTSSLGFGVNSNIYITGLKNNKVYSDSIMINGTNELRAQMNTKDQLSIGIGLNSELSFTTGTMFRPTINVGFFLPFGDEDLTPYLALGPGFSVGTKKVKFSLSGGWAFGKVNTIAERYKDKDLSQFSTIEDGGLTEKVWKSSWQIGIGLSYNLTNKQEKK